MSATQHNTKPLFAVVWQDFGVPLILHCKDQAGAIELAKDINHRRAILQPELPYEARARPLLLEPDDTIHWLDGNDAEGTRGEGDAVGAGVPASGSHVSEPDR